MTSASDKAVRPYVAEHADEFFAELVEWLRIPSISSDPASAPEVRRSAEWLAANVRETEKISDPRQLARMDLEFHEAVVRAAGHGRLLASWLNLRSQIRLIMVQRNLTDADSRRGTVRGHQELLEAIQARDEAEALAALEHHLHNQGQWILSSFTEGEGAGSETA